MGAKITDALGAVAIALASLGVLLLAGAFAYDVVFRDEGHRPAVLPLDMEELPSSDCWYEVGMRDRDGKPGGIKITEVQTRCP